MHTCSAASAVSDSAAPWTVARQAPLSIWFSGQEHWRGWPCPPPGHPPHPGMGSAAPASPALRADSLPPSHWEALLLGLDALGLCRCFAPNTVRLRETTVDTWKSRMFHTQYGCAPVCSFLPSRTFPEKRQAALPLEGRGRQQRTTTKRPPADHLPVKRDQNELMPQPWPEGGKCFGGSDRSKVGKSRDGRRLSERTERAGDRAQTCNATRRRPVGRAGSSLSI